MKLIRWLAKLLRRRPRIISDDSLRYHRTQYAHDCEETLREPCLGGFIQIGFVWQPQQNRYREVLLREGGVGAWFRAVQLDPLGRIWPYYAAVPAQATSDPGLNAYNYAVIRGYRDEEAINSEPAGCVVHSGLQHSDRLIR